MGETLGMIHPETKFLIICGPVKQKKNSFHNAMRRQAWNRHSHYGREKLEVKGSLMSSKFETKKGKVC